MIAALLATILLSAPQADDDHPAPEPGRVVTTGIADEDRVFAFADPAALYAYLRSITLGDDYRFDELEDEGRVVWLKRDVRMRVLAVSLSNRCVEARVLEGEHRGRRVYVDPIMLEFPGDGDGN